MAPHQDVLTFMVTTVLLALPSQTYGEILHIRPTSTNTSCPTHTCHTLSELVGEHFNNSTITLQFLQGIHTLDGNLTITNIQQLEMLGNSSTLRQTSIVCSSHVGLIFRNISLVRIDGLAFASCGGSHQIQFQLHHFGVVLELVQMTEITNCTFRDSFGSALGVFDSHVAMRGYNSFFNGCRKCSNRGCYSVQRCYGGGVHAHTSSVTFSGDTTFSNNSASLYAGGVYAYSSSNVTFSGSSTFSNNSAGGGGGVYAGSFSSVTFSGNTTFSNNSASRYGGGVSAGSFSSMTFSGITTFGNNSAGTKQ